MTVTAILFAIIGIFLTFAPDYVMTLLGISPNKGIELILQLLGAAYYAFAMLNWMAKGSIIGGIYNKPIALANLTHFFIGGMALSKAAFSNNTLPIIVGVLGGFYLVCALIFWLIMSKHPGKESAD
ncbi:hypothetical protein RG47T_4682 [Mucilaginibacter polytrichastri]|uniref:Uncharacterized protein n=2 Tax=Mucilaginibacter polytrichastri TaxID=1302689 RepID=A0A1Q6A5B4_9SPHI|nr:hypothetical protein RG47T_4682 [Mucilaginibacter polytrichastri]SFS97918.1 hypothetical protein SAMN04487890_107237 [Mucilaginibacter polytrichastri]